MKFPGFFCKNFRVFCGFFDLFYLLFFILRKEDLLRAVTTATAAAVLQMDRKSFDNFLLRIGSDAVPAGRQGVERRIALGLLEELLLAKELNGTLGVPAREAFVVARRLLGRTPDGSEMSMGGDFVGSVKIGTFVQLGADLSFLRSELRHRYETAVETVVRPQRGRPPRRATMTRAEADA